MFTLRIDTENAAFSDDGGGDGAAETARILRVIAGKLDAGQTDGRAVDLNGNTVGKYGFSTLLMGRGTRKGKG